MNHYPVSKIPYPAISFGAEGYVDPQTFGMMQNQCNTLQNQNFALQQENLAMHQQRENQFSPQSLSVEIHIDVRTSPQQVRRVKMSGANASVLGGLVADMPPAWLWKREWNLMRVTRRGLEPPSDWLDYKASNYGFSIRLR